MSAQLTEQVKELDVGAAKIIDSITAPEVRSKGLHDYVTDVDVAVSNYLCERLPQLLPGSRVISEEADVTEPDDGYCWIIDPIDGTSNFICGSPEYAISIGLIRHKKAILGVVYAPSLKKLYYAAEGHGAFCNGEPIRVSEAENLESSLILSETNPYSSSRETNLFQKILTELYPDCIDYRITGSAALDCCYIACGCGGVFVAENLKPWDYAAGEVLIREAGGMLTTFEGKMQTYEGSTSVLAAHGPVHEEVLNRLRKFI